MTIFLKNGIILEKKGIWRNGRRYGLKKFKYNNFI